MLVAAGCGDAPERAGVVDPPLPVVLEAAVNVQMGDAAAGTQPAFTVTGQARATRGGVRVDASVDSVLVYFRRGAEETWTRHLRRPDVPFAGRLPFEAVAGERYELWALLYASGFNAGDTVRALDEWVATGHGFAP